ncbi:MAG: DUF4325 domain-containing protein [Clostridia bacterium]|nr:DUF4325 domain-containing protein [Clostridia bacterium]
MKFETAKKESIMSYILEKISQNVDGLSKKVAEEFNISTNTVHSYLNELQDKKIITKSKRGVYQLETKIYTYNLQRSSGHLNSDTYAFDSCLFQHIKNYDDNVLRIWNYVFSEMTNNVMDHSQAENLKVVVIQNYTQTTVMLVDDGVGIFNKIKEHFSLSSLDEAICELFKGKLTTDEKNHSGEGIFFSSKVMDTFFIVSSGKVFATTKYNNDLILNYEVPFDGTCVVMSLSNFTHKKISEVFDSYSNDEGSFVKTRIPLKNIFDTAPISRSQAKRICNRLDNFTEVILDFEDLDWMGQGFAHQLFVVYQNANPDIKLIPINMNDSIKNMYNHVING